MPTAVDVLTEVYSKNKSSGPLYETVPDNAPPHNVMSKIRLCGRKNWLMLHPPFGKFATGMPKVEVSTLLALPCNELGTSLRYEKGLNNR